jgi:hypothetical protein
MCIHDVDDRFETKGLVILHVKLACWFDTWKAKQSIFEALEKLVNINVAYTVVSNSIGARTLAWPREDWKQIMLNATSSCGSSSMLLFHD